MYRGRPRSARDSQGQLPPVDPWKSSYANDYSPSPPSRAAPRMRGGALQQSPDTRTATMRPAGQPRCCDLCDADPGRINRKAFLVGINYKGQSCPLNGCINDVKNMSSMLISKFGFSRGHVKIQTDDGPVKPTKDNIMAGIRWLLAGAKRGDQLFFHFSGHGTQIPDTTGREEDRMAEALVPLDHRNCRNLILDDELTRELFDAVPAGVLLIVICDCCHSGTLIDDLDAQVHVGDRSRSGFKPPLPEGARSRHLEPPPDAVAEARARAPPTHRSSLSGSRAAAHGDPDAVVFLFSGCRDHQTSADAYIDGESQGAFSWGIQSTLKRHGYDLTYKQLIQDTQEALKASRFSQDPVLSTDDVPDLDRKFMAKTAEPESPGQHQQGRPPSGNASESPYQPSPPKPNPSRKPRLGIFVSQSRRYGVEVVEVVPDSPAAQVGLREGDVIVGVENSRTPDLDDFKVAMRRHNGADVRMLMLSVERRGRVYDVEVDTYGGGDGGGSGPSDAAPPPQQQPPQQQPSPPQGANGPSSPNGTYSQMIELSSVNHLREPYTLGLAVADTNQGISIVDVGEEAAKAGLRKGDVVQMVAGRAVQSTEELCHLLHVIAAVGVYLPFRVPAGVAMLEVQPASS